MKPRGGRSADYSEEERLRRFNIYIEMKNTHFVKEIAESLNMSAPTFCRMKNSKWWKELEERSNDL